MATEGGGGVVEELVENTTVIAVNVTDDSMLRPGEPVTRQVNCALCKLFSLPCGSSCFSKSDLKSETLSEPSKK